MKHERKVAMIGLDGMSWYVLNNLFKNKGMPNLKRIVKKGAKGNMLSTIPPASPSAWTSIATGANPGKHGIYDFVIMKDHSRSKVAISNDVKYPRIHEMLAFEGKKSVVVNLILTYPIHPMNSIVTIADWLAPKLSYHPPNIAPLVKDYRLPRFVYLPYKSKDDFLKAAYDEVLMRCRALTKLVHHLNWNLFFVVFIEPDWIMHELYNKVTEGDPQVLRIFNVIDDFISDISSQVDLLAILSDHGFSKYEKVVHVNTLLANIGLAKIKLSKEKSMKDKTDQLIIAKHIKIPKIPYAIMMKTPFYKLAANFFHLVFGKNAASDWFPAVDVQQSKAFVPTHDSFGIYMIDDNVTNNTIKTLQKARDKEGTPLFMQVRHRNDIYQGPNVNLAPHIMFLPNVNAGYYYTSDIIGYNTTLSKRNVYGHHPEGIVVFYGDDTVPIKFKAKTYDITPTILAYLGQPIPQDTDGTILSCVFRNKLKAETKDYFMVWGEKYVKPKQVYSLEEDKIKERLRKLGYI